MIKTIVAAAQGGAGGGRRWVEMCDKSDNVEGLGALGVNA